MAKKQAGFIENGYKDNPLKQFIGKPGIYGIGPISATGVLVEINEEGYLVVCPSLIGFGENNLRYETEIPTIISNMGYGQPFYARPLREGDIERIVNEVENKKNNN
jgi:hypothetical protein